VVTKKGQITDVKIERGFGEGDLGCHEEAARIIKSMPKWHPGYKNGVPVNVRYSLPLKFKI